MCVSPELSQAIPLGNNIQESNMKTLKTIKAVSAAILFTAGLASAQTGTNIPATEPVTFSVTIESFAGITVTNEELEVTNAAEAASLIKTGVVVTALNGAATGPVTAGQAHVTTNLASWDVMVQSKNNGNLLADDGAILGCANGATSAPAVLNIYSCLRSTNVSECLGTGTVGSIDSPRRVVTLAGSSAAGGIGMARWLKATTNGTALATTTKFTGTEANAGNIYMPIEANINCAYTNLVPTSTTGEDEYTEELTFILTSAF